jgi:hypothetical protein
MTIHRARRITSLFASFLLSGSFAALLLLSNCGTTPAQQASLTQGAVTLGAVAAAHNTTVASLVTKGALFCQKATADAPLIVAVANLSGVPVSVTNASSDAVAATCAGISAIPVPPPADVAATPVVMAPSALPAAAKV